MEEVLEAPVGVEPAPSIETTLVIDSNETPQSQKPLKVDPLVTRR
jgi:hypothetical protein